MKPRGLIRQSIGLIGARRAKPTILKTRVSTRTFGIKFPLDILIIDKDHRVAILKENLESFRVFTWKPVYSVVIELPAGTIKKTNTSLKDQILIQKY